MIDGWMVDEVTKHFLLPALLVLMPWGGSHHSSGI